MSTIIVDIIICQSAIFSSHVLASILLEIKFADDFGSRRIGAPMIVGTVQCSLGGYAMHEVTVNGKKCSVRRPFYIVAGSAEVFTTKHGRPTGVRCRISIPASDPAVLDRAPVVNSGSLVFAAWNLTNLVASYEGRGRFIAQNFRVTHRRFVRPDTVLDARLSFRNIRESRRGRISGKATIVFTRRNEEVCRVSVVRFTEAKLELLRHPRP